MSSEQVDPARHYIRVYGRVYRRALRAGEPLERARALARAAASTPEARQASDDECQEEQAARQREARLKRHRVANRVWHARHRRPRLRATARAERTRANQQATSMERNAQARAAYTRMYNRTVRCGRSLEEARAAGRMAAREAKQALDRSHAEQEAAQARRRATVAAYKAGHATHSAAYNVGYNRAWAAALQAGLSREEARERGRLAGQAEALRASDASSDR